MTSVAAGTIASASCPPPTATAQMHALFDATIAHYLACLQPFLQDTSVSEVMVNRWDEIYIERDGKIVKTPVKFSDPQAYEAAVNNILQFTGKTLTENQMLLDSRLPDGSRVHVAREPCSRHGTVMTIRKFNRQMLDMDWLIELGTLTEQAASFLRTAVRNERNVLVTGGTSSGKTSLLNALSAYIPSGERVVVIEDSTELQLQQEHVIALECRQADRYGRGAIGIRELFRSSLRLRPDRIVIGEVRGGEALDMIQAMTSGHGGSMGTLHANNPHDALNRLETMALMSQVELPLHALRAQIASAIDIIVQMSRHIGGYRKVTQITEVHTLGDDGKYRLQDLFTLQSVGEEKTPEKRMQLVWTGVRCSMAGHLRQEEMDQVPESVRPLFG